MKYLLDTHVWIWSLVEPERLREEVREGLIAKDAALYLSPISVWEFLMLCQKGRLELDEPPRDWLHRMLPEQPIREAPLDFEIAIQSRKLTFAHDDPADRFIAATAIVRRMTLVTADRRLLGYPDLRTMPA